MGWTELRYGYAFWSGQGNAGDGLGFSINNAYYNWGGSGLETPNEPDDYNSNQDAAGIALAGWPAGTSLLGEAGEWNDINMANELYFVIDEKNNSIDLTEIVDPSIIGGMIVRVGDKQVDESIKRKLTNLEMGFSDNLYVSEI